MKNTLLTLLALLSVTLYSAPIVQGQGSWASAPITGFVSRLAPASCVLGGKIYVMGGDEDPNFDGYTNSVQIFDPATQTWSSTTNMVVSPSQFSCNSVNGKIYAFGGFGYGIGVDSNHTVEVFDSATNVWSIGLPMPTPRSGLTSSVVNDKIYVIGGINGYYSSVVEIFYPSTNTWITGPSLPSARYSCTSCTVNGKIYVFGGMGDNSSYPIDSLEIFDTSTNSWSFGPPMPTPRASCASSVVNGKIYVMGGIGGITGTQALNKLEIFDPSSNTWSTGPEMLTGRYALCSSAVNGKIYALAGSINTEAENTNEVFTPDASDVASTTITANSIALISYPNPFSQSSTITFSSASSGEGEVTIVNLLGAEVARIFSGELGAGEHSLEWDASGVAPGIYECVVRVNGSVQRVPLAVLK